MRQDEGSNGAKREKKKRVSFVDGLSDVPKGQLPEHLELQRTRHIMGRDAPSHADNISYSGAYMSLGVDNGLEMENFRKNFIVEVKSVKGDDMLFDLIGIDAALANAFRRILIAEVPTMAIEKVYIANNTSIIQDEVLAHRLGMVPIKADPRHFEYASDSKAPDEHNTIVFSLNVRCKRNKDRVENATVLSDKLEYLPEGSRMPEDKPKKFTTFTSDQSTSYQGETPIAPTHPDIILAKLRPNQAIELEAHAVKGQGKTHAKWSPVATAFYRNLPEVVLKEPVEGELAEELVKKCPVNVFDIEETPTGKRAYVARPRDCTLCRECVRGDDWDQRVELRRVRDHFIFSIESTGALRPDELFLEAVTILSEKCEKVLNELT